ncbi:hypothetical protein T01_2263 [Trichinella spiralis]|uniref:Uncharacterized protein n=1 Tax=Trichinella spiralis TaxID=6334 RepID=A0A0V1B0E2_TRISP|nr:hypothetical protein T01_2263 [Trichinella spiralis]
MHEQAILCQLKKLMVLLKKINETIPYFELCFGLFLLELPPHAWYLLETLKESTSMYNGNYSEHLTNNGVLTSNFVPIKVCRFAAYYNE